GFGCGVEVPGRDVFAPDEDFAVRRNLHVYARDSFSYRTLPGAEGMVQRDDWRRFGEPVALNHDESELAPERLELRRQRRRADDERPEFEAEQAMDAAEDPPAERDVFPASLTRGFGAALANQHMFAQNFENLRNRDEHRNTTLFDLRRDLRRVV